MTEIYLAEVSALFDTQYFDEKLKSVSAFRTEKAVRFKRQSDRALSLGAGLLLSAALKKHGIDEKYAGHIENACGKPYLESCTDIYYNLSHSGSMAMCVLSNAETGCDIELLTEPDMRIAEKFFTDKEREYIAAAPDLRRAFFEIWTLKESLIKATGLGLTLPLNSFTVLPGRCCCLSRKKYHFAQIPHSDYSIAVCGENDLLDISVEYITL